jgi:hypothetical protein
MALASLVIFLQLGLGLGGDIASPAMPPSGTAALPRSSEPQPGNSSNQAFVAESGGSNPPQLTATSADRTLANSQLLSLIYLPPIRPTKPEKIIPVESSQDGHDWLILSIIQHSAAGFDAFSTRQAISSGAREVDPMMRPFAQSPAIYAAIQGGPVMLDFVARRMQRNGNNFIRKTWWLPQSVSTAVFLLSGAHNLHVASQR